MTTYVYDADIERVEDRWIVAPQAFPGCFGGGDSIPQACENASIALRLFIAKYIDEGRELPRASCRNPPNCILCVDVDEEFIKETSAMTVRQSADELGLKREDVESLMHSGELEAFDIKGETMVTIKSVNKVKLDK